MTNDGQTMKERSMKRALVPAAAMIVGFVAIQMTAAQEVIHLPPGATVSGFDNGTPLVVGAPAATTVQLPTFNFFTINTTVNVPDRGSASLGGIGRGAAASGTNGGPGFANRAGGSVNSTSGMSVGVQIHDLAAMDQALLDEARAAREIQASNAWADRVAQARQSSAGRPTISVAEARRLRDATAPAVQR
jgi:hypothetical protein